MLSSFVEKRNNGQSTCFLAAFPCNVLLGTPANVHSRPVKELKLNEYSERMYDKAYTSCVVIHRPEYRCHPRGHDNGLACLCPKI